MKNSEFEWDDEKARKNIKKHGVSFEEAPRSSTTPRLRQFLILIIQKQKNGLFHLACHSYKGY